MFRLTGPSLVELHVNFAVWVKYISILGTWRGVNTARPNRDACGNRVGASLLNHRGTEHATTTRVLLRSVNSLI